MSDRVLMSTTDGVCHVRLNRGDKMNALDPAMFEGLTAALEALAADGSIRVIVLSGEGNAFCAGLDLGSFGLNDDAPSDLVPRTHGKANWVQQMGWGWRQLPVPVISAVHGVCFGGGLQLMAGSDIKIIHPETRCAVMEMRGAWCLICRVIRSGAVMCVTTFCAVSFTRTRSSQARRHRAMGSQLR